MDLQTHSKNSKNERETEYKLRQRRISKGSSNKRLHKQTILQEQQTTLMPLSTTTCPYSINQLKEEMESLHASTTIALQQAWNETQILSVKCTFQAQEIESLKEQLEDVKKNEQKWKQKCKELNNQMIIMLENFKPKSWYPNRFSMPSRSLSSRIPFTSYLKKDKGVGFSRSERGMNSSLLSQNSISTRNSARECQDMESKLISTDLPPEGSLRNKDIQDLTTHEEKIEESQLDSSQRDIHIRMNSSSEKSTKEHLHKSLTSFKMKLDARDNEIASLEMVIVQNLRLIHLLGSEIDSRNDEEVVFKNLGTNIHDLNYVLANKQTKISTWQT